MSYIVHGGPLFWGPIAAAVVAVLAWRWLTHRHFHLGPLPRERYVPAHAPGGGVSPRAAAGSGVPGGGDAGDFPAGRGHLPTDAERTVMFAQLAPECPRCGGAHYEDECDATAELAPTGQRVVMVNGHPSTLGTCPGCGQSVWVSGGRIGAHDRDALADDPCPASGSVRPWEPAPQPVTPEPDLEPLPLPDYLPAPAAVHYAPDVPQAAECGPDHAYDDLYRDTFQPQPKGDYLLSVVQERHPGLETGLIVDDERAEPEPQTVTDMRPVPAAVAAREHAISRIRLKAHVSVTLARKPPLRQYVEDVIGISPAEDWEQLLVKARAGGSDE